MPSPDFLILHPDDNVAVATHSLPKGAVAFAEREIRLAEPVRMGHKMALAEIAPGGRSLNTGRSSVLRVSKLRRAMGPHAQCRCRGVFARLCQVHRSAA